MQSERFYSYLCQFTAHQFQHNFVTTCLTNPDQHVTLENSKIVRNIHHKIIYNYLEKKIIKWRLQNVIQNNLDTLPYGYWKLYYGILFVCFHMIMIWTLINNVIKHLKTSVFLYICPCLSKVQVTIHRWNAPWSFSNHKASIMYETNLN